MIKTIESVGVGNNWQRLSEFLEVKKSTERVLKALRILKVLLNGLRILNLHLSYPFGPQIAKSFNFGTKTFSIKISIMTVGTKAFCKTD